MTQERENRLQGRKDAKRPRQVKRESSTSEFIRAANEDDDGYDPYSDRPPTREPLFAEDPWR